MAKKKRELTELEKDGFKLVPDTVGCIIDSIWHNEERQELKIRFAAGRTLTFKPLENEISSEYKDS
jgi:hypothetical protein